MFYKQRNQKIDSTAYIGVAPHLTAGSATSLETVRIPMKVKGNSKGVVHAGCGALKQ